jgi:hypothetical protein
MGSKSEAKKAPVDIIAKVIETLDTFIAEKKVTQCNAIKNPTKLNFKRVFRETFNCTFLTTINNKTKKAPNNILYQTNEIAFIDINAPNIAVKPQINTIKCK